MTDDELSGCIGCGWLALIEIAILLIAIPALIILLKAAVVVLWQAAFH